MIIVNLAGGLGNQMFQYAFGRHLALLLNQKLVLNVELYLGGISNRNFDLDIFDLPEYTLITGEEVERIKQRDQDQLLSVKENGFRFNGKILSSFRKFALSNPQDGDISVIITGYWQSPKYFDEITAHLSKDFCFKNPAPGKWLTLQDEIRSCSSIMINVRRGDYLNKLHYHGVVDTDYLFKAMNYFISGCKNPCFYVFSDDIPWCRANIKGPYQIVFVGESYYDSKYQYYMQLMISCHHFILSNSTFCWWAAWLGTFENKTVIAPQRWFAAEKPDPQDLFPENWMLM